MIINYLYESLSTTIHILFNISMILVPLMISIEFAKHYGLIKKISKKCIFISRLFFIPPTAIVSIFIGMFFGIVSGSGILIKMSKEEKYNKKHIFIIFTFVGLCHAIFEETVIFVGTGLNLFILAGVRLTLALIVTCIVSSSIGLIFHKQQ